MRGNKQLCLKLNFLTQHCLLLISKHSCRLRHVHMYQGYPSGNCDKRDNQNMNSFSSWYKVHDRHLHTCIKIIMCKKRTNWFSINLQKYLPTEVWSWNLHIYVIFDILYIIMIQMINSTHFGDFFFFRMIS